MYKQLIESILEGNDSLSEEIFKKIIYKKSIKLVEQIDSGNSPVVVKNFKDSGVELKGDKLLVFSFNFTADVDSSHAIKEHMTNTEIAKLGSNPVLTVNGDIKFFYNTNIEDIHYKMTDIENLYMDYVALEMVYYTMGLKYGYAYYEGDGKFGVDSNQSDEQSISQEAINYIKTFSFKEFKEIFPDLKIYANELLTDMHNDEEYYRLARYD